ncbi:MAG: LacI family transcriptional regulator [Armatimonadetes bacterium]|nr:LacI family transcriptional regulator [Armatimonadota bacterium]MCX7968185.1 LacI family transcriptional regulator [Armatimonadota bacterium]MDW8142802.1 LacI family DNA-binding transcriptional regulator [Armatimonadota bacterium]
MVDGQGKRVTIRDIAKRLGISPATVSTALTGRRNGVFVSEETRKRVWEVAREMGYPLERLRAKTPKLKQVALFCTSYHWSLIFINAIMEFANNLSQRGGKVLLQVENDGKSEVALAHELYRRREVDGFIFLGSRNSNDELPDIELPYVVIGEVPEGSEVWQVCSDNENGGRIVGEHLWNLGHRKVGVFLMESNLLPSLKRLRGLKSIWERHGFIFPEDWVLRLQTEDEHELAEKLPKFIFDGDNLRFTALFCYNDRVGGTTLKCLNRLGIKVPEDISVVGFDNEPYSELFHPPLTTVEQPFSQLVSLAVQLLEERLSLPPSPHKQVILPCRLIVRSSTSYATKNGA